MSRTRAHYGKTFAPVPSGRGYRKMARSSYAARSAAARSAAYGQARAARMAGGYNRRMRARNVVTAGFLGVEKKFYDTALPLTTINNTFACASGEYDPTLNTAGASTPGALSCPAQGDGPENRDGKRIVAKYLDFRGCLRRDRSEGDAVPNNDEKVLVAIVLDTQSNAAQMNSEDCFKNLTGELNGVSIAERNLLFGSRFRILKMDTFNLDRITLGNAGGVDLWGQCANSVCWNWFIPLNNLIINFNAGTTSDIANVIDNSIHCIALSTNVGGTKAAQITYNCRLRFMG